MQIYAFEAEVIEHWNDHDGMTRTVEISLFNSIVYTHNLTWFHSGPTFKEEAIAEALTVFSTKLARVLNCFEDDLNPI